MSGLLSQTEIRTLLVDDEDIAIYRLKKALESYPQIQNYWRSKRRKNSRPANQ